MRNILNVIHQNCLSWFNWFYFFLPKVLFWSLVGCFESWQLLSTWLFSSFTRFLEKTKYDFLQFWYILLNFKEMIFLYYYCWLSLDFVLLCTVCTWIVFLSFYNFLTKSFRLPCLWIVLKLWFCGLFNNVYIAVIASGSILDSVCKCLLLNFNERKVKGTYHIWTLWWFES